MADALSSHAAPRDPVELLMNERNQSLEGGFVAVAPFEEQLGYAWGIVRGGTSLDPFRGFCVATITAAAAGLQAATTAQAGQGGACYFSFPSNGCMAVWRT